ncbi:MAG: hypothetical protein J0H54_08890, partial [Rhizobiales bacterium]|nr:hypothetical protein [Hyphomicrobiales bacterium]
MARIYLHIGIEKTGTTSLQAFLRENHFALQQRGLDYVGRDDSPYFEGIAHGPLAACLLPQAPEFVSAAKHAPADGVLAALRRDIDAAGSAVVLSSEHFSSRIREVEPVRRLAAALAGHEVRIVCYVRRQDDLALAGYTTAVRAGRRDPFDAREALLGGWYYDLRRMLALWAGVFGRESMIVRKYRTDRDWDVRRDFLDVVGIEPTPDLVFGQAQNVSLDAMQVELLRIVNAALPSRTDSDRLAASTGDRIRALVLDSMPKGAPLGSMLGLIDRNRIIDRFSAGNRAIEAEYMEPGALADWFDLVPGRPGRPGGA